MNCPERECVGVVLVWVGSLARSFAGGPRHNSGSDPRADPRLAAQPAMRRTKTCPPMRRGAKSRPPVRRYRSEMAHAGLGWTVGGTGTAPLVAGRCPSIRHWHSAAASRSLVPVTVPPRPPARTGTTPAAHRGRGGPTVQYAESAPIPWARCAARTDARTPPRPASSPCGSRWHSPSR